jgi:hypothetical protein
MRSLLLIFLLFPVLLFGQNQYPIQTIFRGDSVVILTIKQSDEINKTIDEQNDFLYNKSRYFKNVTDSLNIFIATQNQEIDSLKKLLDSLEVSNKSLLDSIWKWSLSPSIIFTQSPTDTELYVLDLSRYFLTTDDYGIFLPRMSDSDYKKFLQYSTSGEYPDSSDRGFGGLGDFEYLGPERVRQRKVWKHKSQWKK